MNPCKRSFSFEHWYMFYFYDVQLWERKRKPDEEASYTTLVSRLGRMSQNGLGATSSSLLSTDDQIIEVAGRITELAEVSTHDHVFSFPKSHFARPDITITVLQEYWFLLDQSSLSLASASNASAKGILSEEVLDSIRGYTSWLPFNPELNSVAKLYLNHGLAGAVCSLSPAPFCCSKALYAEWKPPTVRKNGFRLKTDSAERRRGRLKAIRDGSEGNHDDDGDNNEDQDIESIILFESKDQEAELEADMQLLDEQELEEAIRMHKMIYVDRNVFLHRLYVGLDMHFGNRTSLHAALADFLPETRAALVQPTQGRVRELGEARRASMQRSLRAAEDALVSGMPSFHWAEVYRI